MINLSALGGDFAGTVRIEAPLEMIVAVN